MATASWLDPTTRAKRLMSKDDIQVTSLEPMTSEELSRRNILHRRFCAQTRLRTQNALVVWISEASPQNLLLLVMRCFCLVILHTSSPRNLTHGELHSTAALNHRLAIPHVQSKISTQHSQSLFSPLPKTFPTFKASQSSCSNPFRAIPPFPYSSPAPLI